VPCALRRFSLGAAKVKVLKGLEEGVPQAFVRFFNSALFDRLLHGLVLYFVALLQQELLQHWTERTRTAAHAGERGVGGAWHAMRASHT
jgi:hypothetical protein